MSAEEISRLAEKPFRFFDLPRELRDAVYDILPSGRRIVQEAINNRSYRVWRGGCPMKYLFAVNKQFGSEYSERAHKKDNLRIQDTRSGNIIDCELSRAATKAAAVLNIDVACLEYSHEGELDAHIEQVHNVLAQMTNQPALRVRIYFEIVDARSGCPGKCTIQDHKNDLDQLEQLAALESLELYSYIEPKPEQVEVEGTLRASYTKSKGWETVDTYEGTDGPDSE